MVHSLILAGDCFNLDSYVLFLSLHEPVLHQQVAVLLVFGTMGKLGLCMWRSARWAWSCRTWSPSSSYLKDNQYHLRQFS